MSDHRPEPYVPEEHSHLEELYNGDLFEVVTPFFDVMGSAFPVLVIGGVMSMLWVYSDDIKIPTIVGIIMSSVTLAYMPGSWLRIIGGLMTFLIAVALFSVWSGRDIGGGRT